MRVFGNLCPVTDRSLHCADKFIILFLKSGNYQILGNEIFIGRCVILLSSYFTYMLLVLVYFCTNFRDFYIYTQMYTSGAYNVFLICRCTS